MKGVLLENLTWVQSVEAFKEYQIAVIPVGGATKEHGPHLPNCVDFALAEEFKRRVAEKARVIMLPTVPYAYYPAFVDWPGSVSIKPETFAHYVMDIVRSIARHGIKKFVIINMGISTTGPLDFAARELTEELGVRVAITAGLGRRVISQLRQEEAGTHAGEYETSLMLVIRPEMVDMTRAVKELPPRPRGSETGTRTPPAVNLLGKMSRHTARGPFTATGVSGDATLATREKGDKFLEAMEKDLLAFLEDFERLPVECH